MYVSHDWLGGNAPKTAGTGFYRFWREYPNKSNGQFGGGPGAKANYLGSNCTWERPELDVAPGTCVELGDAKLIGVHTAEEEAGYPQ